MKLDLITQNTDKGTQEINSSPLVIDEMVLTGFSPR